LERQGEVSLIAHANAQGVEKLSANWWEAHGKSLISRTIFAAIGSLLNASQGTFPPLCGFNIKELT
jgi:hypothetical protein